MTELVSDYGTVSNHWTKPSKLNTIRATSLSRQLVSRDHVSMTVSYLEAIISPHVRESKKDSGFYGFQVVGFIGFQCLSVEIGFWIPDSNRLWDSGFLELYSGFHKQNFLGVQKQKFPGFQRQKFPRIPESGFLTWGESFEKLEKFTRN